VGKAMLNGQVLYKNIFEQKGPLLYFIYGIGYLISNTTFIGVYVIEIIAATFFLYSGYKIFNLFVSSKASLLLLPIVAALTYGSTQMVLGGSCEELMLPLLAMVLYFVIKSFKMETELSFKELILIGVAAGCVLWMKYTALGFFAGAMFVVIIELLIQKKVKKAVRSCAWFLAGFAIATTPWIIYFLANNALLDMWNSYFYLQLVSYKRDMPIITTFSIGLKDNAIGVALLITLFFGLAKPFSKKRHLVFVAIVWFTTFFATFIGGHHYEYYGLILHAFIPVFIANIVYLLHHFIITNNMRLKKKINFCIAFPSILVIATLWACMTVPSIHRMFRPIEKTPQYIFTQIIHQYPKDQRTLITYRWLDTGVYTMTNIMPTQKYFCWLNINTAELREGQDQALENKEVTFVVSAMLINNYRLHGFEISDNYVLLKEVEYDYGPAILVHLLYVLKERQLVH